MLGERSEVRKFRRKNIVKGVKGIKIEDKA